METSCDALPNSREAGARRMTAYKAMVTIGMSVQSYREGRVLYFDEHKQKVVSEAPKA